MGVAASASRRGWGVTANRIYIPNTVSLLLPDPSICTGRLRAHHPPAGQDGAAAVASPRCRSPRHAASRAGIEDGGKFPAHVAALMYDE